MTKDEFIEGYCKRSEITREYFDKYWVALPCECDYEGCHGWAKVSNDKWSIENHIRFYTSINKEIT